MGKSKVKQQLKRKISSEAAAGSSTRSSANGGDGLSKKQLKKQRRQAAAAAAQSEDDESNGNDGELREIEDLDFDDAFAAGLAFEQMESFEGALAAFQTAVKARPDHLEALSHLADVYAADEQPQQALKTYLQASKLGDADASIWFRLGMTYMSLEQHDLAIKSLKKSLVLSAKTLETISEDSDDREDQMKAYSVTLAALANCHGEQGNLDGAIQVYTDAVASFPTNGNLHYNLAAMLMAKGGDSEQQVVASLERAIECSPETIEFYEDLIEFLQQTSFSKKKKNQQAKVEELQRKVETLKEDVAVAKAAVEKEEASDEEEDDDSETDDNDDEDDDDEDDD